MSAESPTWHRAGVLWGALLFLVGVGHAPAWAQGTGIEVRRVGLSRVGDNTLLTVVLNRPSQPDISVRGAGVKPQLVVEFPRAQGERLPSRLAGDDILVEQVRTEAGPSARGVRIVLELFPERPYSYWRQTQPLSQGQTVFILGIKSERGLAPPPRQESSLAPEPPSLPEPPEELEPEPTPAEPPSHRARGPAVPGSFGDLKRLAPKAASLFQYLETEGWRVSQSQDYDRPGQRFSRGFMLTNARYPEMVINIANLPANTPGSPNITIVALSTENVKSETAAKYQELRKMSFSQIRAKFKDIEDVGDFFDDALKPLRVKLRQETKDLALRQASLFQNFLQRAVPRNPRISEQVLAHIKEKVNQRFEGVQYTESEDPLVLLNLVDFLYVRVYFLDGGSGGG